MQTATTVHPGESEVTILARILGKEGGRLPAATARYVLSLEFSDRDKARMHDLAIRNQNGTLSPAEKDELVAFAKAGSLLSILKSRARRTLSVKPRKRIHT
jgi:hypothetical protein